MSIFVVMIMLTGIFAPIVNGSLEGSAEDVGENLSVSASGVAPVKSAAEPDIWVTSKSLDLVAVAGQNDSINMSIGNTGLANLSYNIWFGMGYKTWKNGPSLPVVCGQSAAVLGTNGLIYVFGGYSGSNEYRSVYALNPQNGTWVTKSSMPGNKRGHCAVVGKNGTIFVLGGIPNDNALYSYNTKSDTWKTLASNPDGNWECAAALGKDGKVYVFGGEVTTTRTCVYDPVNNTWSNKKAMPQGRMQARAVTADNGLIYVMGGRQSSSGLPSNLTQVYNPKTDTWSTAANLLTAKNQFLTLKTPNGKIITIGGGNNYLNNRGAFFNVVEMFDPKTNTWQNLSLPMPSVRKELSGALDSIGNIYAIGGANGSYMKTVEILLYDEQISWLSVTPNNGTITPANKTNVTLMANASKLKPGIYHANITIKSNDPSNNTIKIPVNFTVLSGPHDMRVLSISVPEHGEAGKNILINATIFNQGTNNETNITVQLKVDGVVKNSTNISSLLSAKLTSISLAWKPVIEKFYKVEIYIVPVTGETIITNNQLNKTLRISAEPDIWVDPHGFNMSAEKNNLTTENLTIGNRGLANLTFEVYNYTNMKNDILVYTQYSDNTLNGEFRNTIRAINQTTTDYSYSELSDHTKINSSLNKKSLLLIPEQERGSQSIMRNVGTYWKTTLNNFLKRGGTIVVCDYSGYSYEILNRAGLMSITGHSGITGQTVSVVNTSSPLATNLNSTFTAPNGANRYTSSDKEVICSQSSQPVVICKKVSNGHVILIGVDYFSLSSSDANKIVGNSIKYYGGTKPCEWLTINPDNGSVTPLNKTLINLTANCTLLDPGIYRTNITVESNDLNQTPIIIPVNFTVLSAPHDMRVLGIDVPTHGEAGKFIKINATIFNQGSKNETNITVQLKIDGVVKNSTNISSLSSGKFTSIYLAWKPMSEKLYKVEIYIVPVTGENITNNNQLNKTISVTAEADIWIKPNGFNLSTVAGMVVKDNLTIRNNGLANLSFKLIGGVGTNSVLVLDGSLGGSKKAINALIKNGFTVTNAGKPSNYTGKPDPFKFGVIIIFIAEDYSIDMPHAGQNAIKNFTKAGGGLILTEWFGYHVTNNRYKVLAPLGCLNRTGGGSASETYTIQKSHPITDGVKSSFTTVTQAYSSTNLAPGATLLVTGSSSYNALACRDYGLGKVVHFATAGNYSGFDAWSDPNILQLLINSVYWTSCSSVGVNWLSFQPDNGTVTPLNQTSISIIANATLLNPGFYQVNITIESNDPIENLIRVPINFTVLPAPHDIRVFNINVPSTGEAGKQILINSTIFNQGTTNESNITIQLRVDGILINSTNISKLNKGEKTNISFIWVPMAEKKFIVEIYAVPVQFENITFNNRLNDTIFTYAEADIWVNPTIYDISIVKDETETRNLTIGNSGLGILDYSIPVGTGIISGGTFHNLPTDPNSFSASHDIVINSWRDGGNDAFDGYGMTEVRVGGISQGYLNLSNNTYTTNGFKYKMVADWPDNNVLRLRLEPISKPRKDIDIILSGNLGSDSSTQSFQKTFDFYGNTIKYMVTNDGSLDSTTGDPQISHYMIPSNPAHLSKVYYNISGDNPTISIYKTTLPVTIYIIPSYLSHDKVNAWVKTDLTYAAESWLSVTPMNGTVYELNKTTVKIAFNTTGLLPGIYRTNLTVQHNDPSKKPIVIPVNLTVLKKEYDVYVIPKFQSQLRARNTTIVYNLTIMNIGKNNDTYNLSIIGNGNNWTTKIYNATGAKEISSIYIPIDSSKDIKLKVTIPPDAASFETNIVTLVVRSQNNTSIVDEAKIRTYSGLAIPWYDDFESGVLSSNWTVSGGNYAGVSSHTYNSGNHSMYTHGGVVRVSTIPVDTTGTSIVQVSYWVRMGSWFSERPDSGEDLIVEYFNKYGSWINLDTFYGSGTAGRIYSRTHNLTGAAIHKNFKLRFRQTQGSGFGSDYWHIDDVYIGPPPPSRLTISGSNVAPTQVTQDDINVNMTAITITSLNSTSIIKSISMNLTGTGKDSDIDEVRLVLDTDSSGDYSIGDITLGSGTFTNKKVKFKGNWIISKGVTKTYLVVFNISLSATVGKTVGVNIKNGDITSTEYTTIIPFTAIQSTNSIILEKPDFLAIYVQGKPPNFVEQGQSNVEVMGITLDAQARTVSVNEIDLDFTGTGYSDYVAAVKLYVDTNDNGKYDPGLDIELGNESFKGVSLTFKDLSVTINEDTDENLLVLFDITLDAKVGFTVGAWIGSGYIHVEEPDLVFPFGSAIGGPFTVVDSVKPTTPIGLAIDSITHESITLTWEANMDYDIVGYNIYRSKKLNPSNWGDPVGSTLKGNEQFTDIGLEETTTYYYVVSALDEVPNESDFSNIVSGTTLLGPHAPEINIPLSNFKIPEDAYDDTSIELYHWFKDLNNDKLEFRCEGENHIEVIIYQDNGTVVLIPEKNWNGEETIIFYAKEGTGEISDDVTIIVTPVNDPPEKPEITGPIDGFVVDNNVPIDFWAICNDPDIVYGDELSFRWYSNISGELSNRAMVNNIILPTGIHKITVKVSDLVGETSQTSINVTVLPEIIEEPELPDEEPDEEHDDDDTTDDEPTDDDKINDTTDTSTDKTKDSGDSKGDKNEYEIIIYGIIIVVIVVVILITLFALLRKKKRQEEQAKAEQEEGKELPGEPPVTTPAPGPTLDLAPKPEQAQLLPVPGVQPIIAAGLPAPTYTVQPQLAPMQFQPQQQPQVSQEIMSAQAQIPPQPEYLPPATPQMIYQQPYQQPQPQMIPMLPPFMPPMPGYFIPQPGAPMETSQPPEQYPSEQYPTEQQLQQYPHEQYPTEQQLQQYPHEQYPPEQYPPQMYPPEQYSFEQYLPEQQPEQYTPAQYPQEQSPPHEPYMDPNVQPQDPYVQQPQYPDQQQSQYKKKNLDRY